MDFNQQLQCKNTLENLYTNSTNTTVTLVHGNKGLGKATAIKKFLNEKKHVIKFSATGLENSYLQTIENSLRYHDFNENITNRDCFEDNGLFYEEKLRKWLLDIVSKKRYILYFENLNKWSKDLLLFMKSIFLYLTDDYSSYNTFIILKLDKDDEAYLAMEENFLEFYSVFLDIKFIPFKKLSKIELKKYISLILKDDFKINEVDYNYILKASSGNIMLLNIIINYLKQEEYITQQIDGIWVCDKIPNGTLLDVLKNYIRRRYERLHKKLQETLRKSALIGTEIDPGILEETFQILRAQEYLEQIEGLTNLLIKNQKEHIPNTYNFENIDVFHYIMNELTEDERQKWYTILLNYYDKQRKELMEVADYSLDIEYSLMSLETNILTSSIAYGQNGDNIIRLLMSLITRCVNNMNFLHAINLLNKTDRFYLAKSIDSTIQCRFLTQKAYCLESLGHYAEANDIYIKCIKDFKNKCPDFFTEYYQYKNAYCTYYMSNVNKAFKIAQIVYTQLQRQEKTTSLLYFQIMSLLSTLYKEKGDYDNALKYFNVSLQCCKKKGYVEEYYIQLRKSCLVIEMELAIPMIEQSVIYFQDNNNIKELAKARHNLASNYLYIGRGDTAWEHLTKAQNDFESFGSNDIVVTINNIGIWYAMYQDDIEKAQETFCHGLNMKINDYKRLTLLSNLAICYLMTDKDSLFLEILEEIERNPSCSMNDKIPYYQTVGMLLKALANYRWGKLDLAAQGFIEILENRVTNRQRYLLSNFVLDIDRKISIDYPPQLTGWSHIKPNKLFERYFDKKIMFRTLRFVE